MKTRFVPQILFASTIVGAIPACGDDGTKQPRVIALAIAGFTGCPSNTGGADASAGGGPNPCGTGGIPNSAGAGGLGNASGGTGGRVIVLAVMGFTGGASGASGTAGSH
jgi:hypothetical protein